MSSPPAQSKWGLSNVFSLLEHYCTFVCTILVKSLCTILVNDDEVKIIAEPGRYFCSSLLTLVTQVTSKRSVKKPPPESAKSFMYYINDGIYGSFNCLIFDHVPVPTPIFGVYNESKGTYEYVENDGPQYECSLWGPTCDSMDVMSKSIELPELNIGDRMVFKNMGAYTLAPATSFNGFNPPTVYYLYTTISFDSKEQQKRYLLRINQEDMV